jgi:hypothetical protein
MKFQAAAMGRANVPEDQRSDFSLYVDEFQNFATDSFETILSEARKYRLNLILANQFMTQLTEKIREAIIGNVGTIISGRIGTTDAELMEKKFAPTFTAEDLTRLPNFESITSVMINNVPSAPFSMSFIPPLGKSNPQLADALKKLSYAKYGRPRKVVEKEIFDRLRAGDIAREEKRKSLQSKMRLDTEAKARDDVPTSGSSFLDEWLAKRKQIKGAQAQNSTATTTTSNDTQRMTGKKPDAHQTPAGQAPHSSQEAQRDEVEFVKAPAAPQSRTSAYTYNAPIQQPELKRPTAAAIAKDAQTVETSIDQLSSQAAELQPDTLQIRQTDTSSKSDRAQDVNEIFIDVRGNLHHKDDTT